MNLFDMHCDTLFEINTKGGSLVDNHYAISINKASYLYKYAQFFALYCGNKPLNQEESHKLLASLLTTARKEFFKNREKIVLCKNKSDLELANQSKQMAAFLSIEGAELVQTEEDLKMAYDAGVRLITITWNHENIYGFGANTANKGLTERGKQFVGQCQDMGIIMDVSHLSECGFWDVAEISKKPFVATHSNSRVICNHIRNLNNEQFLAIMKSGGVVGINLYNPFLTKEKECSICDIFHHVDHFLSLGGENNLVLGADFDGCDQLPNGINDIRDMYKLHNDFLKIYDEALVNRLFYDNLYKFIMNAL